MKHYKQELEEETVVLTDNLIGVYELTIVHDETGSARGITIDFQELIAVKKVIDKFFTDVKQLY